MESHDLSSLKAAAQRSAPWPPPVRKALVLPVSPSQTTSLLVGLFLSLLVLFAALSAQVRRDPATPAHPALALFAPAGPDAPDHVTLAPADYFAPASSTPGDALYELAAQSRMAALHLQPGDALAVQLPVADWQDTELMAQRWQVLAALFQPGLPAGDAAPEARLRVEIAPGADAAMIRVRGRS